MCPSLRAIKQGNWPCLLRPPIASEAPGKLISFRQNLRKLYREQKWKRFSLAWSLASKNKHFKKINISKNILVLYSLSGMSDKCPRCVQSDGSITESNSLASLWSANFRILIGSSTISKLRTLFKIGTDFQTDTVVTYQN